jgi:Fe-S cluster assembly protein SufD
MSEPLQLIFVTSGKNTFANPRIQIVAQKFSSAKFVASFISRESENSFNNVITEFTVGENATLVYDKIQNEAEANFHISTEEVAQEKNSNFKINTVTLDGTLVRNNINISVNGENCETHMNGVIIAKGNAHVDNHTFVNHKVANCFSNENYKYVMEDKSTGVFNGRVIVQQHAQKINAYQKNGNILLSDFAQIFSKPELEIYADDVKCSHGSTTGQLDENAIFYLQARGISKDKAKKLLVSAFVGEVIEQFSSDAMHDKINQVLVEKHNWTI